MLVHSHFFCFQMFLISFLVMLQCKEFGNVIKVIFCAIKIPWITLYEQVIFSKKKIMEDLDIQIRL